MLVIVGSFHLPWTLLILGALPSVISGILIMGNYRHISGISRIIGFIYLISGAIFIGIGAETSSVPAVTAFGNIFLLSASGAFIICLLIVFIFIPYWNRPSAWRRRGQQGVLQLMDVLKNGDPFVSRSHAALILGELDNPVSPVSIEALIQALEDKDISVRAAAAMALGRIGDEQVVSALQRMFETEIGTDEAAAKFRAITVEAIERIQARDLY